jgi:predicted aconitase with swiveling domain
MTEQIVGRVLHAGSATAPTLRLDAPLSFWGGFDPSTGLIIDQSHPQAGASMTGHVVVMPGSRGSSGTPGALAESLRLGTGPSALVVQKADINLTAGAVVAAALYGSSCPIVLVDRAALDEVRAWPCVTVADDGRLRQPDDAANSTVRAGP